MVLGNNERTMLRAMITSHRRFGILRRFSQVLMEDQVFVAGAGKSLEEEGPVEHEEAHRNFVSLGQEG